MEPTSKKFKTVDEYFSTFPKNVKNILTELRKTIKQAAPQAEELISYNMPAFKLNGILVYYAAYNKHIGFYPTSSGIETFKNELSDYKWAKGSIQFPLDKPLPTELITNIVKFRVMRNSEKAATKTIKK
ncbi:MAG: DUF1801 domain-containing protein [Ignavibacteriaceae bacterium]|nr:DUF1801 domain-containing protein [Ignavibacteriaceae bacterium]